MNINTKPFFSTQQQNTLKSRQNKKTTQTNSSPPYLTTTTTTTINTTMVDVDRRMSSLNTPSHTAALRRLSVRASAPPTTTTTPHPVRNSLLSFTTLTIKIITHLRNFNIKFQPGLTETEFARIEAKLNFSFPPDLKAVLSAGLPSDPGFPDWRSRTAHLKRSFDLPIAAISCQIVNNTFWAKSWGVKPSDPEKAIAIARSYLRKVPILIPIFDHCYIPCNPCLAGNPIFFIDETRVYCCGFDLSDFYDRFQINSELTPVLSCSISDKTSNRSSSSSTSSLSSSAGSSNFSRKSNDSGGKTPRWVEFWSDAGTGDSCRSKNSLVSSPGRSIEVPKCEIPKWVDEYIDEIGSVLRKGGWKENDVDEIKQVSAAGFFDGNELILLDNQAILDALLLKADRFSNSLRKSGWSSEEVSDALGFDFALEKERNYVKNLTPELVEKIGKLAESVLR